MAEPLSGGCCQQAGQHSAPLCDGSAVAGLPILVSAIGDGVHEVAGPAAVGTLIGGLLAGAWAITTPLWIAAAAMTAVTALAWRPLRGA
jgi:hypothetical protein